MAEETSRPAQLWDTLQEAASTGDLQRLKDALAQWDAEDTDVLRELNMAEFTAMQRLLQASARAGHADVAGYLMSERGCVVSSLVIRPAMMRKHWAVLQLFLDRGWWDINRTVDGGNTLPLLKDILPSEEHVQWCLEHGADPNAQSMGRTNHVLGNAASDAGSGRVPVRVLRLLRDAGGADFARSDALHHAVRGWAKTAGNEEARERRRKALLEVLTFLVDEARFPIDQVEWAWDAKMFEGFRRSKPLGTALNCAARERCMVAIEFLLERGAAKDIKDTKGKTAVEAAEEIGFEEGVAALR